MDLLRKGMGLGGGGGGERIYKKKKKKKIGWESELPTLQTVNLLGDFMTF